MDASIPQLKLFQNNKEFTNGFKKYILSHYSYHGSGDDVKKMVSQDDLLPRFLNVFRLSDLREELRLWFWWIELNALRKLSFNKIGDKLKTDKLFSDEFLEHSSFSKTILGTNIWESLKPQLENWHLLAISATEVSFSSSSQDIKGNDNLLVLINGSGQMSEVDFLTLFILIFPPCLARV